MPCQSHLQTTHKRAPPPPKAIPKWKIQNENSKYEKNPLMVKMDNLRQCPVQGCYGVIAKAKVLQHISKTWRTPMYMCNGLPLVRTTEVLQHTSETWRISIYMINCLCHKLAEWSAVTHFQDMKDTMYLHYSLCLQLAQSAATHLWDMKDSHVPDQWSLPLASTTKVPQQTVPRHDGLNVPENHLKFQEGQKHCWDAWKLNKILI